MQVDANAGHNADAGSATAATEAPPCTVHGCPRHGATDAGSAQGKWITPRAQTGAVAGVRGVRQACRR